LLSTTLRKLASWVALLPLVAAPLALCQAGAAPASTASAGAAEPQIAAPAGTTPATTGVARASIGGFDGIRVASVQLQSAVQLPPGRFEELVTQKPNQAYDRGKVRQSVIALFGTGKFADVEVQAERTQRNEVTLVFVGRENFFVGVMTITGAPRPPSAEQLLNASKLQLGELFAADQLPQAFDRMKRVLAENGYYQADVKADTVPHADTQQIDVHFHVTPGPLARVGAVNVQGQPGYTPAEVREIAHLHPGDKVSVKRTTTALERLRKKYTKQDRMEAQVAIAAREYHPETNRLDYTLQLVRGPSIDVHVTGTKISKRKLKKYVPVYEEFAVDEDLLNEGRRNIRDYLQTKGYFDAQVTVEQQYDPTQDHRHILYHVELGEKHKLEGLKFTWTPSPNSPKRPHPYFEEGALLERMQIQPANLLLRQGRFSESLMVRDKESIESLYHASGFQNVKVSTRVQDDYKGERGHMLVTFHIDEQPQTLVNDLKITGTNSVPERDLQGMINTHPGEPFSEFNMAGDRDAILNYYFNRGFPHVKVEYTSQPLDKDKTLMNVSYTVDEGQRVFVDRVLISGLNHTKPHIVRREFQTRNCHIWDGDPLSENCELEAQRRLYDLGIFNEVNMAVQNPEGAAEYKNLLVHFDEARRWTFTYGFGLEAQAGSGVDPCSGILNKQQLANCKQQVQALKKAGFSPRVSFDVTRLNFRGRDQTLAFKSNYGRLQKRALLSFESPRWFDRENLRFTLTTFFDKSNNVYTFAAERLEGSAQVEQAVSRITTFLYRFSYRRVKVDQKSLAISPELVPLLSQPVRVGMPSFTYIRDKRDDPIDSHRGNYTTADFGVAGGFFGSESNFGRILIQNSTYMPFKFGKNAGTKDQWVFARSTRIGTEGLFGKSTFIPLPERFFEGGGSSHRGFPLNQAGPRDATTGAPLGGGAMLLNNLELRTPSPTLPFVGDNVSFVVFEDAGNVFNRPNNIFHSIFKVSQPLTDSCRLTATGSGQCNYNFLSHAVGAGIRYRTPIGPVRVDLGYNLNPPKFPVSSSGLVKQPGRIQFFFSIGQTF
jgi:outer membrane protein assembly factor BamA